MKERLNGKQGIAVDVDDVLFKFVGEWIKFYNARAGTNFGEEDVFSMALWKVIGLQEGEEVPHLLAFYESGKLKELQPIDGAKEAVSELSVNNYLGVITARDSSWEETTLSSLSAHYPNFFSGVHFAYNLYAKNPFWRNGNGRKSEICLKENYNILIDDSLETALECSEKGLCVLLFGDYRWNRRESLPENIIRVRNWQEALEYLEGK